MPERRLPLAVLGGTFDHLHAGHHALLATAFQVGDEVAIGLTTERFIAGHPKPDPQRIEPYAARRSALARWIGRNFPGRKWRVVPLEDAYGRSVEPTVDVLVVSRDTLNGARAVNRERRRLGRSPIPVVIVPLVLADDLEPISSRRVRAGEIGTDGRRFAPIRIALATTRYEDRPPAERAILRVFPQAQWVAVPRGASTSEIVADLVLRVTRRRMGGWLAVERSPRVRLAARPIRGSRAVDLERGLLSLLRPREQRKLFGTPRS